MMQQSKISYCQSKLLIQNNGKLQSFLFPKSATIGRNTEGNKVSIDLKKDFVCENQGQIGIDENGCFYIDLSDVESTFYNQEIIKSKEKIYLHHGDVIRITDKNSSGNDGISIVFENEFPEKFSIGSIGIAEDISEISIGKGSNNTVVIPYKDITDKHASFFKAEKGWAIIGHNSADVYLNNIRIPNAKYIKSGDCIRISNINFFFLGDKIIYQNPVLAKQSPNSSAINNATNDALDININERSVWQRAKKLMLLQDINMKINPGEMVLILGGSGAGKTTFMNAVMGYEKAEGSVMHGETDVYESFESIKTKIGFVPQQDLIRGGDTVIDTLENAAEMKLPSSVKKAQRNQRIDEVLNTLGLNRERDNLVSKLSGGQRKRLSIAVEYIANPSLFFLDEPDSGLDGVMAKSLMNQLRSIADEGKIVLVISHGPDRAAELFDKVIVLAKSTVDNCGHLAFFGTVDEAYKFFDVDSLEGVVRRINRTDEGGDGKSDYYIEKYKNEME